MPFTFTEENGGELFVVHATGRLAVTDYEQFVPEFERLVREHGTLRMLFELTDFRGWSVGALWSDTTFAMHHFSDIERLAVVGEKAWQHGLATFIQPFTRATVRYFEHDAAAEARRWLNDSCAR